MPVGRVKNKTTQWCHSSRQSDQHTTFGINTFKYLFRIFNMYSDFQGESVSLAEFRPWPAPRVTGQEEEGFDPPGFVVKCWHIYLPVIYWIFTAHQVLQTQYDSIYCANVIFHDLYGKRRLKTLSALLELMNVKAWALYIYMNPKTKSLIGKTTGYKIVGT